MYTTSVKCRPARMSHTEASSTVDLERCHELRVFSRWKHREKSLFSKLGLKIRGAFEPKVFKHKLSAILPVGKNSFEKAITSVDLTS